MQIYFKYILSSISSRKGFTVAEFIVVIGIATVIMTSLVIQQSKWNDSLIVSTQAFEMALMIRQAQVYGLGVREYTAGTGDKFDVAYGVYFSISNPTQYIFFVDKNKDGYLNAGEALETKTLTRGVVITKVCAQNPAQMKCSDQAYVSDIIVTFSRPLLKAKIMIPPGNYTPPVSIYLSSPGGNKFYVRVRDNGAITISRDTS